MHLSRTLSSFGRDDPQSQIHFFPNQKFLYVEVPKAGCTSIKYALKNYRGEWTGPPGRDFHEWFGYRFVPSALLTATLTVEYAGWTKITVVRNPYDRFLSLYSDKLAGTDRGQSLDVALDRFESKEWYTDPHGRPQADLVGHDLTGYDFVGRTERMDDVFLLLSKVFRQAIEPLHENRTPLERRSTLNHRHKEEVFRLYERDFALLGYPE